MYKKVKRMMLYTLFGVLMGFSGYLGGSLADYAPREEVSAADIGKNVVLAGGMPAGIYMETNGVLVLDTQSVEDSDGIMKNPAHNLVKAGDYIVGINGETVAGKKDLMTALKQLESEEVVLRLRRDTEELDVKVDAVECEAEEYKLGIWVRDNVQGLGTITFLNGNSEFGALGHGIHDTDTGVLMEIEDGRLYKTSIRSIVKGENGLPGSMEGLIVYNEYNRLGTITKNTEAGIYGKLEEIDEMFDEEVLLEVAEREEIETGSAVIRCFVDGEIQEYEVEVTDVDYNSREMNKGIVLQVTDPRLLEQTGGIIQGMSGSPIIQNGKLIGAVTHVFVNDPSRGYGIFAETMLEQLG